MAAGKPDPKRQGGTAQPSLFGGDVAPAEPRGTPAPRAQPAPRERTQPAPVARRQVKPAAAAFNYTDARHRLIVSLVETLSDLRHIDPDRLLVAWTTAKVGGDHGTYAKIVPLRFKDGASQTRVRGRTYEMAPLRFEDRDILYLIYFFLPRFHERPYRDKLATVIHELYHISPDFNGDIRRFPGRNYAHGHSREVYHRRMEQFADEYEALRPECPHTAFLRLTWPEFHAAYPKIVGRRIPLPKAALVAAPPKPGKRSR